MSIAMVQRYTRFEDRRAGGKSVLAVLAARKMDTPNGNTGLGQIVKHWTTVNASR